MKSIKASRTRRPASRSNADPQDQFQVMLERALDPTLRSNLQKIADIGMATLAMTMPQPTVKVVYSGVVNAVETGNFE